LSILEAAVLVFRRLSTLVLSLMLLLGSNLAVCAGWAATPEARMACCTEDDTCPMHKGESHDSSQQLTQSQAVACCAASEPEPSNQSAPSFISVISSAVLGAGVVLHVPVPSLVASDAWRTVVPIPIAPVPRHVLLSVFLV
jgi:hypothetical protein